MKNKWNITLIVFIILSCVFAFSPLLLRVDIIYRGTKIFLNMLQIPEYKSAYISALGGMIGSGLAVTSALCLQRRTEKIEKQKCIQKSATIVYYDINLFYRENDILASRIKEVIEEADFKIKIQKFLKLRGSVGIHIDSNWISNVAELVGVLNESDIETIYRFYGNVSELEKILCKSESELNVEDFRNIETLFYNVGIKKTYYKANEKIEKAINELNGVRDPKKVSG